MNTADCPVVLIPGFMLDETLWDDFTAHFPQRQRLVPVNLTQGTTIQEIAANIVRTLPDRFVLVGFSLGGYVARAIYEAFPERTTAMILVATSLQKDSAEQKRTRMAVSRAISARKFTGLSTAAIRKSLHTSRVSDSAIIEKVRTMGKRLGADVFRTQAGLNRERLTIRPVACPVYIIAAKQDRLRSSAEAEALAALTGARVDYVEDCGHLIPLEKPKELAQLVSHWLIKNEV